jgi:nucleotide-binding universal stress UspA family protein
MYTKILVPLDGSKVAEQILPYAGFLAGALKIPVELMGVIDIAALAHHVSGPYLDTVLSEGMRASEEYLKSVARTFDGISVQCNVERGKPEEVIIGKAATDKATLIAMATHGRSGMKRWLLG